MPLRKLAGNTMDGMLVFTLLLAAWAFVAATETGKARPERGFLFRFFSRLAVGDRFELRLLGHNRVGHYRLGTPLLFVLGPLLVLSPLVGVDDFLNQRMPDHVFPRKINKPDSVDPIKDVPSFYET